MIKRTSALAIRLHRENPGKPSGWIAQRLGVSKCSVIGAIWRYKQACQLRYLPDCDLKPKVIGDVRAAMAGRRFEDA